MSARSEAYRYPAGTGWVTRFALGVVGGAIAWFVSGEVTIGLILFVATGTALGFAFEQSVDSRPLTTREQRIVWVLIGAGLVVGALVALYVAVFA